MQSENFTESNNFFFAILKKGNVGVKWRCIEGVNIAPLFQKLITSWRLMVNFIFQPLCPAEHHPLFHVPLHRRLGGPRSWPGSYGKEKKIPLFYWELNPIPFSPSPGLYTSAATQFRPVAMSREPRTQKERQVQYKKKSYL
jgi:hypothetical protein